MTDKGRGGVTIRAATAADAAAVAALIRVMAEQFGEHSPVTAGWVADCLGDDGFFAIVAELDGDLVGVVTFVLVRGLFHAKKSAVIGEASVTPAHQGKGLGRALLQEAIARIKQLEVAEISISTGFENERAKHLYRSLGFVEETLMLEQHLDP